MERITIFGEDYTIVRQKSNKDWVELNGEKIFIKNCKKSGDSLLKDYLSDSLYFELFKIYDHVKKRGIVDIFGNLDFEIVEKIDGKKQRVAKLKQNKIVVKLNAVVLPKSALKYLIVHEIAHTLTKKHSEKFWKIVKTIYPDFESGQKLFINCGKCLHEPLSAL